jgi:hypothetical protein
MIFNAIVTSQNHRSHKTKHLFCLRRESAIFISPVSKLKKRLKIKYSDQEFFYSSWHDMCGNLLFGPYKFFTKLINSNNNFFYKMSKVSVIGAGNVGATCAYAMSLMQVASEVISS